MKLRKLHIDDYKMFKDFDISFVDENDEVLPIVVLAGVNGSGKTSLLKWIHRYLDRNDSSYMEIKYFDYLIKKEFQGKAKFSNYPTWDIFHVYFPSGIDDTQKVEKLFVKYWYNQVKFHNKRNDEITESLQKFIIESFDGLNLAFNYSGIDEDDNIFFQNNNDKRFKISELSTGEQILLSKVLYLYLSDYTNKLILIDEPELSLHPSWQNKVLKIYENFAKQNNCQIIIATHSPHIIASAKNEYLRFLRKDEEGNIEAIENITAYGRDIEWVLQQMGVVDIRLPKIVKRFDEIQELINNQEFYKAESALDKLEYVIGENDKDILALRNDLAFERMDFEEDN